MADDKPFTANKGHSKATVPESFPDIATCGAKKSNWPEFYLCLNSWGSICHHVLLVEQQRYCNHATNHEIYSRTAEAGRTGRDSKDGLK